MVPLSRLLASAVLMVAVQGARSNYSHICESAASESYMDMSSWFQAGTVPRWQVLEGGRTIKQYINSPGPGFYISDDADIIDVVIKGTIEVSTQYNSDGTPVNSDNDYIGFLIGAQGPLPSSLRDYDGMIFSWGGVSANNEYDYHSDYTVHKLNGTIPTPATGSGHCYEEEGACFWFRHDGANPPSSCARRLSCGYKCNSGLRESVGCYIVSAKTSSGWVENQRYAFAIMFTDTYFKVSIDGEVIINLTQELALQQCRALAGINPNALARCDINGKAWRRGRLAWYNLSQHGVTYGNIRKFIIELNQPPDPVAREDIYGVSRTAARDGFKSVTREFYTGILANDWSPSLSSMSVRVAAAYSDDPEVSHAANGVATCQHGSILTVQPNGAFTYQPDPDLVNQADKYALSVETCRYKVQDGLNLWSPFQNVTFALEPFSLECPPEGCFTVNYEPYDHDYPWYGNIDKGSAFGEIIANGSCLRITDYQLPDGGAGGRFSISGGELVASRPDAIVMKFLERSYYQMSIRAIDIFGNVANTRATVVLPALCEVQAKCVCTDLYTCHCFNGFAGDNCELCDATRVDVSANPNCTLCADCPLPPPAPAQAQTVVGPCMYPTGGCTAFCTRNLTCSGRGVCVDDPLLPGGCECDRGWAGDKCDECAPNFYTLATGCDKECTASGTCNGLGTCDAAGDCVCAAPWGGPDCTDCQPPYYPPGTCDQTCTADKNCSGNGECGFDVNGYPWMCNCEVDWIGPWLIDGCNISCSRKDVCSDHGECFKYHVGDALGNCVCDTLDPAVPGSGNWVGDKCDNCTTDFYPADRCDTYCHPAFKCKDRGDCDSQGVCVCYDAAVLGGHFAGDNCSVCKENWYPADFCDVFCSRGANCSGNGDCSPTASCVCDAGYQGPACDECASNYFESSPGVCDVFCERTTNCSSAGECNSDGACECYEGYSHTDCSMFCTRAATCSDHGDCVDGVCECDGNFNGTTCSGCVEFYLPPGDCSIYCDRNDNCSGNGDCSPTDGHCLCDDCWTGTQCAEEIECVRAVGEFGEADCLFFAVGDLCLGWLVLILSALIMCLLVCCLYWLLCRKRPAARANKKFTGEDPLLNSHEKMGGWTGADLGGMDGDKDGKRDNVNFYPADTDGMDANQLSDSVLKDGPAARGDLVFGPGDLGGMDPAGMKKNGFDFGPADLDGMDPSLPRGGSGGAAFGPADIGGMDPLGLGASPNRGGAIFGPGDLAGMGPLASKFGGKNLSSMDPIFSDAVTRGKVPAAVNNVLSTGTPVTDPDLEIAKRAQDLAARELSSAIDAADAAGLLPAGITNPNKPGWGPGDMSGMDPAVRAALEAGKLAAVATAAGAAAGTPLGAAKAKWDKASAQLRAAAAAAADKPATPPDHAATLLEALGLPASAADRAAAAGSGLADTTQAQALASGAVPAAVREVVGRCGKGAPDALKKSVADFDKKQQALEKALRDVAANPETPAAVRDDVQKVLAGNWGPADLSGMDPVKAAMREGAFAAVARDVLTQGGVPKKSRAKLEDALKNGDKSRTAVTAAAAATVKSGAPGLDAASKEKLEQALRAKGALNAQAAAAGSPNDSLAREAAARGRAPAGVEAIFAQHAKGSSPALADLGRALEAANHSDAVLKDAARAMGESPAKTLIAGLLANPNCWGPPEDMSGMDPAAVDKGKTALAARHGLRTADAGDADRKKLEQALVASDRALAALRAAGTACLQANDVPVVVKQKLSDIFGPTCPDFTAPDAGLMAGMDPLQRAAQARGKVAAAVQHVLGDVTDKPAQDALSSNLARLDAAERTLAKEAAAAVAHAGVPEAAKSVLKNALADRVWGPAGDMSGMDPLARAALSKGQVAAAAAAVLNDDALPADVRQKLNAALQGSDARRTELTDSAKKALVENRVTGGAREILEKALVAGLSPLHGFNGDVALNGMDPLQKAAITGLVPVVVSQVVSATPHYGLQAALSREDAAQKEVEAAVRGLLATGGLPAAAEEQLRAALGGQVAFLYGNADLSGMDPLKSLLEQAVRSVVAAGGLPASGAAQLQAALATADGASAALKTAVKQAIVDPSLPSTARADLQDALYGKARLTALGFTGTGIDLASDEFAPLMLKARPSGRGGSPYGGGASPGVDENLRKNAAQVEKVAAARAAAPPALGIGGGANLLLGSPAGLGRSPASAGLLSNRAPSAASQLTSGATPQPIVSPQHSLLGSTLHSKPSNGVSDDDLL